MVLSPRRLLEYRAAVAAALLAGLALAVLLAGRALDRRAWQKLLPSPVEPDPAAAPSLLYLARTHARLGLAQDVIAGRLSLMAAAARNLELSRQPPAFPWKLFRQRFPDPTDLERHGRMLIELATGVVEHDDPCWALALRARLERDLRRHRWGAGGD